MSLCSQELARQLNNEVLPKFREAGVKLFMISIGPAERGKKFHDLTGLPEENILADPDNVTYSALQFKNDTFSAFFSWEVSYRHSKVTDSFLLADRARKVLKCWLMQTPKALWRRIREDGAEDLKRILKRWPREGFFIPPKNEQVRQTAPRFPMTDASALQTVPVTCRGMSRNVFAGQTARRHPRLRWPSLPVAL